MKGVERGMQTCGRLVVGNMHSPSTYRKVYAVHTLTRESKIFLSQ